MKTNLILTALLLGLTMPALCADEPGQTCAPAAATACADEHPFLPETGFPRWSQMTGERAVADINYAIERAKATRAAICAVRPEEATYDNTFGAYESLCDDLELSGTLLMHLSSVHDNPDLRAAKEKITPVVSAFESSLSSDAGLWAVLKPASQQPWVKELSPEKQRYVKQVTDSFIESGADLPADKKARKAEIETELAKLTDQFDKNVLDSTNAWTLHITDPAQLAGMTPDWMAQAHEEALAKGFSDGWLVTLKATSAYEILRNCDNAETRRAVWEGMNSIGCQKPWDNAPIVERIMELRRELASLLGFGNYCDLMSAHRMIDNSAKAQDFIYGMMERVKPAFDKENAELLAFAAAESGRDLKVLDPWDVGYYARKMMKKTYDLDPEALRPYQSFDNVRNGMFELFGKLYDISFRELPTACIMQGGELPEGAVEVWDPAVKCYAVIDNKTQAQLGSFYLDPFPRADKRAGAWVLPLRSGEPRKGDTPHAPHLATLCGNMSPPVGDKPALFSHYDVETLFHEFGHMMHVLLSDTELRSHSGTNVAWDFVEMPSQLNENWTWEPESMALYARHYETGAPMPEELVKRLIASRFFRPASDIMGQLCYARLDYDIHVHYDPCFAGKDLDTATLELLNPWRTPVSTNGPSPMRHLTHCVSGGYCAGYYCYKWAEVLQADAFSRFKKEGILNPETGASYRREILSKGDSEPAADLFRAFMGRDPNTDALLQEMGILPAAN